MKQFVNMILILSIMAFTISAQNITAQESAMYTDSFNKLLVMQKKVIDIHPVLENLYPIAIYKDTVLTIFEPNENGEYVFSKKVKSSRQLPPKIMAAFPLAENDNKMTCVVHDGIFDTEEGYVFIFHEFFHCYQFYSIELPLKRELEIHRHAMETKNYMWEINHAFPYDDPRFEEYYTNLMSAAKANDFDAVKNVRAKLKDYLSEEDFEYMTWQEWKEGSARWVENKIRLIFETESNDYGKEKPYNRV